MPSITADLDLEISRLRQKLGQANADVDRFAAGGAAKGDRFARGFEGSVTRGVGRAGNSVTRFFSGFRGAARATVGIAGITTALVVLNRRFPVIGQVAGQAFSALKTGAAGAVTSTLNVARAMTNIKTAATAALAVYSLARAFRALRGAGGGEVKMPRLPTPRPGAGLLGGAARSLAAPLAGLVGFGAIAGGFGGALKSAGADEQFQVSMEVLVGDAGKAKALIGQLRKDAASTPLSFGDLGGAARQLLAFGEAADNVPNALRRIGDISTAIQAPIGEIAEIYGKARVQGTLFAEDINQLTGRGIPVIQQFAAQLGVAESQVKKMGSEGKITFGMLEQAFINLTSEGGLFAGMMGRQAGTLMGLWSTFLDTIEEVRLTFGKPIAEAIKPVLSDAIGLVETMKERAAAVGEALAGGIDFARAAFQELSGGELLAMAGNGLKLAFMSAVNVLGRGMLAVFKAVNDVVFMDELERRIIGLGDVLKASLIGAIAGAFQAMRDAPQIGPEMLGIGLGLSAVARNLKRNTEEREKNRDPRDNVELGARIAGYYKDSPNFLNDEEVKRQLRKDGARVAQRAARNRAEREATGDGETKPATAGPTVAGAASFVGNAVQNAVNALFGRPMEAEQVSLLKQIAQNTRPKPSAPPRPPVPGARTGIGVFGAV